MRKYPKIAVCVPSYNSESTIATTLNSLLNQNYPNYMIYVIDNRSEDKTWRIIQKFVKKNPKIITAKRNEENVGMTKNWNKCIEIGDGKLVTIFHSDDTVEPNYLSYMHSLFTKYPQVKWVALAFPDKFQKEAFFKKGELTKQLIKQNFIIAPSVFFKKEVLKKGQFNEQRYYCPDWEVWIELSLNYPSVIVPNKGIFDYKIHKGSTAIKYTEYGKSIEMDEYGLLVDMHKSMAFQ